MTEFSIVHEFSTDPETFWRVFFDDAYNQEFYGSAGLARTEQTRHEDALTRQVVARYTSARPLPQVARSLLGNREIGYLETSTFLKDRGVVEQIIKPTVMTERIRFEALVALEPLGPGRVRRRYSGSLHIDIPLVGKRIEANTVGGMQKIHDEAAVVTRAWLARQAA